MFVILKLVMTESDIHTALQIEKKIAYANTHTYKSNSIRQTRQHKHLLLPTQPMLSLACIHRIDSSAESPSCFHFGIFIANSLHKLQIQITTSR